MHLHLIRYHTSPAATRGLLLLDGAPLGETRESGDAPLRLPAATYRCRCAASALSPMTLQVCLPSGRRRVAIGWDPLRQVRAGTILVGQAGEGDPATCPLTDQEDTFARLTRRVYQAYAAGEDITLAVTADPGLTPQLKKKPTT